MKCRRHNLATHASLFGCLRPRCPEMVLIDNFISQQQVRLACELGTDVGAQLPIAAATREVFASALDSHADEDFSAVIRVINSKSQ